MIAIVTLGADGVLAVDGRHREGRHGDGTNVRRRRRVTIDAVQVRGTTIGCGDAFAAGFLRSWWWDAPSDLDAALQAATAAGAEATGWVRPLPDVVYEGARGGR